MVQHVRILLAELCQLWFYNYYTVQDSLVYLEENGFLIVRKHSKDRTICCHFSWSISLIGFFTRTISSWDMVNQYPYWVKLSISDPLTWITSNFHSFKLPKTHSPASKLSDVIYGCQSDNSFLLCCNVFLGDYRFGDVCQQPARKDTRRAVEKLKILERSQSVLRVLNCITVNWIILGNDGLFPAMMFREFLNIPDSPGCSG